MRKKILIILMALMAVTLPLMADENSASDNFEKIKACMTGLKGVLWKMLRLQYSLWTWQ